MHEALYARQAILPDVDLTELAGALDLDRGRFDACMSDEAASRQIDEDLLEAVLEAKRMSKRGALRRQKQFIGKLMSRVDPEPIRAALARLQRK